MDRVSEGEPAENAAHAYGFTWWMKAIYLSAAAVCAAVAVFVVTRAGSGSEQEKIWHWIEALALGLSAAYLAASAFCSCILFDQYSVIVRGLFLSSSLPREAIHWCSYGHAGWMACTILYTDSPETKKLIVLHCYGFDEEWTRWIASLKRLPS